ncbi:cation:proton antiporter [Streptomyces morookaense]|uniref:Cation:proton antiporter n=1 Tax=Streptomyces morookaense TaxID=1970 RepID=A0A7Y7B896_STRMO|nr:cation:proton antiporter [Streptomyces morookaense]NVK80411.1 cation:proton antiporter [Streptomyces morookaense]GHF14204.1 hypothetical protein GCM10010359_14370 [Streptomyces morookaense]
MTGHLQTDFFLALALALTAARLCGAAARRIGQPPVVGEIFAGILLSPTVLTAPVSHALIPGSVRPLLEGLANIGLAIFMFTVGYELDLALLRGRRRTALTLAAGSVVVPLAAGVLLALPLAGTYAPGNRTGFVLFLGVAMSVTAFPVLARILTDRGLNSRPLGGITLAAAAVGDVAAWLCLAAVVAFCGATGQWHVMFLPLYAAVLWCAVRPLFRRLSAGPGLGGELPAGLLPALTVALAASCAATEWMGVHFIFGAFALGAVLPKTGPEQVRTRLVEQLEHAGSHFLLPLYFIVAGTKVDLSGVGPGLLGTLAAVVAVAVASKAAGAYAGARLSGTGHRMALPIAVLMNTRGLTEIVIVTVGLQMHLIDGRFYSIMLIMAVVTTAMTGPLLNLVRDGARRGPDTAATGALSAPRPAGAVSRTGRG